MLLQWAKKPLDPSEYYLPGALIAAVSPLQSLASVLQAYCGRLQRLLCRAAKRVNAYTRRTSVKNCEVCMCAHVKMQNAADMQDTEAHRPSIHEGV